jgi:hypothetical protein
MNRTALNGATIGSGGGLPWVLAQAAQTLRLVGTFVGGLTKHSLAATTLAISGALRATLLRAQTLAQTLGLIGDAPSRAWIKTYGNGYAPMRLIGTANGGREVTVSTGSVLALTGDVTVGIGSIFRGRGDGILALTALGAARPWVAQHQSAAGTLKIIPASVSTVHTAVHVAADGTLSLTPAGIAHPRTAVHVSAGATLALTGVAFAEDYYTGPAPSERTYYMIRIAQAFVMARGE